MPDTEQFNDSDFDNLPEINLYREKLDKLKSLDLSSLSQKEIHRIVHEHTVFIPNFICLIPPKEFSSYKLYRARFKIDPEKENVYLHSTFSYPNNVFCRENGRANISRRNVFYCADSPLAALLESKPKKGDFGCISEWRPIINRKVSAAIFLNENLRDANKWNKDAKELHGYLRSITPKFQKEKAAHLDLLNEFMCDLFIEEKPPYSISSWISNSLLYSNRGIDMILYPSSITNSYFTNIAIHPNFADKHLELEKVFQFTVNGISDNKMDYDIGLIGFPGTMNIEWRRPTDAEIEEIISSVKIGIDASTIS